MEAFLLLTSEWLIRANIYCLRSTQEVGNDAYRDTPLHMAVKCKAD